jgi:hypothetical protein
VVLALNSANTRLFVLYKNGKSATGTTPQPEADLFRADVSSGNSANYTWTNLNGYVPDDPNYNRTTIEPCPPPEKGGIGIMFIYFQPNRYAHQPRKDRP